MQTRQPTREALLISWQEQVSSDGCLETPHHQCKTALRSIKDCTDALPGISRGADPYSGTPETYHFALLQQVCPQTQQLCQILLQLFSLLWPCTLPPGLPCSSTAFRG